MNNLWISCLTIIFFFIFMLQANAKEEIIINEIAWMGTESSGNNEWIELKNLSNENIVLDGWNLRAVDGTPNIKLSGIIKANDFFLLERGDDNTVLNQKADLIYNGVLSNSGEILQLIDDNNEFIDIVNSDKIWQAGDNIKKLTMEKVEGIWKNSDKIGGSPKKENSIKQNIEKNNQNNLLDNSSTSTKSINKIEKKESNIEEDFFDKIFINEFVFDPIEGDNEWVELYNNSEKDIDLKDFYLLEGSEACTKINKTIKAKNFVVIENLKGKLNNNGDILILKYQENIIDKLSYGNWDDGNINDNIKISTGCLSIARVNYHSGKDVENFKNTIYVSKNSKNIIVEPATIVDKNEEHIDNNLKNEEKSLFDNSDEIVISEIFPNPKGVDFSEWIELANLGDIDVDLFGWRIENNNHKFEFNHQIIKAKDFVILKRKDTNLVLNNQKEKIKLYQPKNNKIFESIEYIDAKENCSYIKDKNKVNNQWVWTKKTSPGEENILDEVNLAPVAYFDIPKKIKIQEYFILDASDSFDKNQDNLKYYWEFGNGSSSKGVLVSYTYLKEGNYNVKLVVSDGELENFLEKKIIVEKEEKKKEEIIDVFEKSSNKIIISEFIPNPEGSDLENEWIEIKNVDDEIIDLYNWKIDDDEGGSSPYKITENIKINPGEYFLIDRVDSNIALNNSADKVRIYDFNNILVDEIDYKKAKEGKSYLRDVNNDEWFWCDESSPGEDNLLKTASLKKNEKKIVDFSKKQEQIINKTDLAELKYLAKGSKVVVEGIVNVLYNVFSSQYFYISDGISATQIYNYKKIFPSNLEVGDKLLIKGELSFVGKETRIKTKQKEDIQIIGKNNIVFKQKLKIGEIKDQYVGQLIEIEGKLIDRKNDILYIDDGENEIEIQIKKNANIDKSFFKESLEMKILGILIKSNENYRILPRSKKDLIFLGNSQFKSENIIDKKSENDEWSLPARKNQNILHYIGGASISIVFIFLAYIAKKKI